MCLLSGSAWLGAQLLGGDWPAGRLAEEADGRLEGGREVSFGVDFCGSSLEEEEEEEKITHVTLCLDQSKSHFDSRLDSFCSTDKVCEFAMEICQRASVKERKRSRPCGHCSSQNPDKKVSFMPQANFFNGLTELDSACL